MFDDVAVFGLRQGFADFLELRFFRFDIITYGFGREEGFRPF